MATAQDAINYGNKNSPGTYGPQQTDYGTLGALGGLAGALYMGNNMSDAYGKSISSADQYAQQMQQQMQQMPTLASMYGQDSPYAQQLMKTLAAKDAAAGRNSQYGNRLVQFQAQLADKGSQYAAQQAQMNNQYGAAQNAANQARQQASLGQQQVQAQQLASLFNLGDKSGLLGKANQGLKGLYDQYFPDTSSMAGSSMNTPQSSFQDRQGYDIPWEANSNGYTPSAQDYSQGGPSTGMYGSGSSNYQTQGAPTDSSNMYFQPDWMNE